MIDTEFNPALVYLKPLLKFFAYYLKKAGAFKFSAGKGGLQIPPDNFYGHQKVVFINLKLQSVLSYTWEKRK